MAEYYHIFKALHIISIIAWMAGVLYLPRLFVYHASTTNQDTYQTFLVMEYKLITRIMHPAMLATYVFGFLIMYIVGFQNMGKWIHIKLALVLIMTACNIMMIKYYKDFKNNANTKSHVFYRFFNEVPTILLIAIVFLAVLKPF